MTWFKRLLAAALCIALTCGLCACGGDKSQIKGTINDFEHACRHLDTEDILECIDPSFSTLFQNNTSILDALRNSDPEQALDNLIPYLFSSNSVNAGMLGSISIKVDNVSVTGDTAAAHGTLSFRVNGDKVRQEINIHMIRVEDVSPAWRISSISFISA